MASQDSTPCPPESILSFQQSCKATSCVMHGDYLCFLLELVETFTKMHYEEV